MIKTELSDSLKVVATEDGEIYTGDGILLGTVAGAVVYLEGEPAALLRLADRINGQFKCA